MLKMNGKITKKLNKIFRVDNSLKNRKLFNRLGTIIDIITLFCLIIIIFDVYIYYYFSPKIPAIVPSTLQKGTYYFRIKMINLTEYYQNSIGNVDALYKVECLKPVNLLPLNNSTNVIANFENNIVLSYSNTTYENNYTTLYCVFTNFRGVDYFTYANNNLPQ